MTTPTRLPTAPPSLLPLRAARRPIRAARLSPLRWATPDPLLPLYLPFDTLRVQRAQAVQAGLLVNSMLGSRDCERAIDAIEQWVLGPWARRV